MAFTEHVLMISSVLKSEKAIQVNIQIMRAFTKMRQMIFDNADLRRELENLREDVDGKFRIVFETLDQLLTFESRRNTGNTVIEKMRETHERMGVPLSVWKEDS